MNKYIFGLDPSLKSTGISIYDLEEERFVHVSHHDTTLMKPEVGRNLNSIKMLSLYNELYDLKDMYPPKCVVIENPYIAQNSNGKLKGAVATEIVYMVHGVCRIVFADIYQVFYAPNTIKAEIFYGHAKKEELKAIIIKEFPYLEKMFCTYGVEGKHLTQKLIGMSEDESDAVCVALTFLIESNIINWVKPERERVKIKVDMDLKKVEPKKRMTRKRVTKKAKKGT